MKNIRLTLAACALLLAVPTLSACATAEDLLGKAAVSASSTSNVQQHSLGAAVNAYAVVGEAFVTYAKVAKPSPAVITEAKRLDNLVYAELEKAQDANDKGNSPAVALALEAMKGPLVNLTKYLTGLGVPVPALPAF